MRKHVTPATPGASVPDPDRGDVLPSQGRPVEWSAHWARLAARGEIAVTDPAPEAEPEAASEAEPEPAEAAHAASV